MLELKKSVQKIVLNYYSKNLIERKEYLEDCIITLIAFIKKQKELIFELQIVKKLPNNEAKNKQIQFLKYEILAKERSILFYLNIYLRIK